MQLLCRYINQIAYLLSQHTFCTLFMHHTFLKWLNTHWKWHPLHQQHLCGHCSLSMLNACYLHFQCEHDDSSLYQTMLPQYVDPLFNIKKFVTSVCACYIEVESTKHCDSNPNCVPSCLNQNKQHYDRTITLIEC